MKDGTGREKKGRKSIKLIMRYLLKYLEDSEGKMILKSILIFKYLKCHINKK
jgi:hypothetical protein